MCSKNLPLAIAEMLGISQSKTPAACLLCLKNVVQTLTLPPKDGSEGDSSLLLLLLLSKLHRHVG